MNPRNLLSGHFLLTAVDRRTPVYAGPYCTDIARPARQQRGPYALSKSSHSTRRPTVRSQPVAVGPPENDHRADDLACLGCSHVRTGQWGQ
jgi:hypothetical protein